MGRRQFVEATVLALLSAVLPGIPLTTPAFAQTADTARPTEAIDFDIPAGSLADGLQDFSDQSGLQLAVFGSDIEGLSAGRVSGRLSPEAALQALLSGTGLRFVPVDRDLIAIAKIPVMDASETSPAAPVSIAGEDRLLILPSVLVSGYRASFARSTRLEQEADQVISAAVAEDIAQFPDQNIAEAAERLPGVQITRRNGEGESVQIRGLSANFTRLEIDGRRTSSSFQRADPSREAAMSIFSADLYDTIEIIKSPKASDVEGGIGGIVRLTTKDPFELGAPSYAITAGLAGGDYRDSLQPSLRGYYSDVLANERVGLWLAGTFERRDLANERVENNRNWGLVNEALLSDTEAQSDLLGLRFPRRVRYLRQTGETEKLNLAGRLEVVATPDLTVYLHGLHTEEAREEDRSRLQVTFADGVLQEGTPDRAGQTLVSGAFLGTMIENTTFFRELDIQTSGLTGGIDGSVMDWTVRSDLTWSRSLERLRETEAEYEQLDADTVHYDIVGEGSVPALFGPGITLAPGDAPVTSIMFDQRLIEVDEYALALDASRPMDIGPLTQLRAGLRGSSTSFSRRQGSLIELDPGGLTFADGAPLDFPDPFLDDLSGPILRDWPRVSPRSLLAAAPLSGEFEFNDENLYDVRENVLAAYALTDFDMPLGAGMSASGNVGLRLVETRYDGDGALDLGGEAIGEFGMIATSSRQASYFDALPSFNAVLGFAGQPDLKIRMAASRIMARPDIEQIQPGEVVRIRDLTGALPEENTLERGNPDLDPYRANQYEIGLQYLIDGRSESVFQLAVFAKDVENFVTTTSLAVPYEVDLPGVNSPILLYDDDFPVNGGRARIRGVETGLQSPFFFLPKPFDSFGAAANYTYTDSDFRDANGNLHAFPGASDHAGNLILFVDHGPLSARLAYTYRSEFLITPAQTEGGTANAVYEDGQARLDLGVRYRLGERWRVALDARNLTGEEIYHYYDEPGRLARFERDGRSFIARLDYRY